MKTPESKMCGSPYVMQRNRLDLACPLTEQGVWAWEVGSVGKRGAGR